MTNLIIIGAGGFGLEIAAYAEDMVRAGTANFAIKGFLDDTKPAGSLHAGYPVLGGTKDTVDPASLYVIAVGKPEGRRTLINHFVAKGAKFASIIHPQSYIARDVRIGAGTIIAPFVFVGPVVGIGENSMLNVHASIGHESRMGEGCILCPYGSIHGQATLGDDVFMGNGSCVTAGLKIGNGARISAGSIVYNEMPAAALAIGNPASFGLKKAS